MSDDYAPHDSTKNLKFTKCLYYIVLLSELSFKRTYSPLNKNVLSNGINRLF